MSRILCWNVHNKRLDAKGVLRTIARYKPDVVALQEVERIIVDRLSNDRRWQIHVADDFIERGTICHLVTLTRAPSRHEQFAINRSHRTSPSLIGRICDWTECLEVQVVEVPQLASLRVINLHLSCAVSPRERMAELNTILEIAKSGSCPVICGDFNTIGTGIARLAGPLFGFSVIDIFEDERRLLEAGLRRYGFEIVRPSSPMPTLPRFRMVLDHFAVPIGISATSEVLAETEGSDHRPILLSF